MPRAVARKVERIAGKRLPVNDIARQFFFEEMEDEWSVLWIARQTRGDLELRTRYIKAAIVDRFRREGREVDPDDYPEVIEAQLASWDAADARDADRHERFLETLISVI